MSCLYCIGCIHFDMTPRDPGCMGSTWTGLYGDEEAKGFCAKRHWEYEFGQSNDLETFRKCMEKAQGCPDYSERATP